MALTEKQARFVQEYLVDLNATQAAIRAGYSEKTARSLGQRLLTNVDIQNEIQKAKESRSYRTHITQDAVLRELAAIGFARATDYAEIDGDGHVFIVPTAELTEEQRIAIAGVKQTKYGVEVKMHDKLRALEMLSNHLGMFRTENDRAEQKARIEKLRREAQKDDNSREPIKLIVEGLPEEFKA